MVLAFIFLAIIVLGIIIVSIHRDNNDNSIAESIQASEQYVSYEKSGNHFMVYFDMSPICTAIRRRIGKAPLSIRFTDTFPNDLLVRKDDLITQLHLSWTEYKPNSSTKSCPEKHSIDVPILSPLEGYIINQPKPTTEVLKPFLVATLFKQYQTLLEPEHSFQYTIGTDAFDSSRFTIIWDKINGKDGSHFLRIASAVIAISFNIIKNRPSLLVRYAYRVSKGTVIDFIFDNQVVLSFPLYSKKLADNSTIIPLVNNELEYFGNNNLISIRIQNGDAIYDYALKDYEQTAIIRFVDSFKRAIADLRGIQKTHIELQDDAYSDAHPIVESPTKNDVCWVYLMKDQANNTYKIGISNKPEYREKTLQSEKPTIVKIAAKQYQTRGLARAFESALHKEYQHKRIRGEWFRLDAKDVEAIKDALS